MDSLELALLEDNKEVLAALDRQTRESARRSTSSMGGRIGRPASPSLLGPRSPTRALLDIEHDGSRRSSHTGFSTSYISHSSYSPRLSNAHISSYRVLDTSTVVASNTTRSAATSPTEPNHRAAFSNGTRPRTNSDTGSHPASIVTRGSIAGAHNHISGNPPSGLGASVVPKKSAQTGWAKKLVPSAMAEVVRGGDLSVFGAGDRGRNHSVGSSGTRLSKSRSPGGWGLRSNSPAGKGKQLERRPSDPKARPANSILTSSLRNRSRTGSSGSVPDQGPNGPRLKKNHVMKNGKETVDDSSDETNTSDEDQRGRKKPVAQSQAVTMEEIRLESKKYRAPLDMFEAIDQERKYFYPCERTGLTTSGDAIVNITERKDRQSSLPNAPKNSSVLLPQTEHTIRASSDPAITVTSPLGERSKSSRPKCRPTTSFDHKPSFERQASVSSEKSISKSQKREVSEAQINNPDAQADVRDIVHAQKLSIHRTVITNPHPSRSVRQIYRGDFQGIQKEAKDPDNPHPRRLRKYLVATDLSSEATHALEWCVGTVLRDGDTLLAVYCVDEEVGISPPEGSAEDDIQAHARAIAQAAATPIFHATQPNYPVLGTLAKLDAGTTSTHTSPVGSRPKAEAERYRAVRDITERVEKLLRKTKLQVKVVIEVIHCKSPKHLITEVIDLVSPTLVILGSRGRSALKG